MRIERWYWFLGFCLVSLCVHLGLAFQSRRMPWGVALAASRPAMVEVTLEAPTPKPQPEPAPEVKPTPRPPTDFGVHKTVPPPRVEMALAPTHVRLPAQVEATPQPIEKPAEAKSVPLTPPVDPSQNVTPMPPGGTDTLKDEKPLPLGEPNAPKTPPAPRMIRIARSDAEISTIRVSANQGGGSPAPDRTLTGKNGAAGPETPSEDTLYTGGGAGGQNLPKAPAKIGGGGGASILSVNNPLAKEAIPDDKPGLGPGAGGGEGTGKGGGAGFRAGKGIGTRREGRDALATLNSKPGNGIGAGQGDKIGTNAPGGGKGTGAEQPGTGGEGTGYGRGRGIEIGSGSGTGTGTGGRGFESGRLTGNTRASFGDLSGLLRGDPNGGGGQGGGPGGIGRGAGGGFGTAQQIPFALKGDIYLLEPNTQKLPDFSSMKPIGSIYATELNIPTRHWDRGFPGVTDRFEWFAIDYNGFFSIKKSTTFKFKLSSDDGSKLLIDDQIVIDNDGLHSTAMKEGSVRLLPGKHKIEVQYFQGPKDEIALVLELATE